MMHTKILNAHILSITEDNLLEQLKEGVLFTPNIDHLVKLQKDEEFYNCYQKAEWRVCDSKILWLCSKLLKHHIPEPIPGSSFFTHFYEYHKDDENCKIFLLGGMNDIALVAQKKINDKIGRNIIVGAYSPTYGFEKNPLENSKIYKMIIESGANVVIVGVGAPKQEKWIIKYKNYMPNVKIWMALGATIDFEAGKITRAPRIMQLFALEWLYRMIQEPKRLFKRYMYDDMKFFYFFLLQLVHLYKNPWNNTQ